MLTRNPATRLLVPALGLIVAAEVATLGAFASGFDVRGFTWLVAALVAGFSLSGSV
ncbi:hypothetical protein AB0B45_03490 [Nonomuraea sp. NPDC049152]|uniref:hypothetical protein n=1 Tax=Nonomuraea sp. NPDC049152 TaxID=3154350 RepID=UPI0033D19AC4